MCSFFTVRPFRLAGVVLGGLFCAANQGWAADQAADSAADGAYDSGWNNGANGGSGFGAWQLSVGGQGGHFTASSAGNAGGSSGNINTGGRAWGLWATTNTTEAVRPLTGALAAGQIVRASFDNGYIDSGKSVGLALRNSSGQALWELYFIGGSNNYFIRQEGGAFHSDIPFTGDGLDLSFLLTGPTSYTVQVRARVSGGAVTQFYAYAGFLVAQADSSIAQVRVWNFEAGGGSDRDVYVNSLFVEPGSLESGDPQVDSWFTKYSGRYARLYMTDAQLSNGASRTTWTNQTASIVQSLPAYSGVYEIYSSDDWLYFRTTGLGSHTMGPWYLDVARAQLFPNLPKNQAVFYRIPRLPVVPAARTITGLGAIGYFVDGVAMFDSRDGFVWTGSAESGAGTGYWNRDAYVNESVTFDPALAHQEQSGTYHYHANPIALRYQLGDHITFNTTNKTFSESGGPVTNHSPLLGWVRDGHPIYGPYGYSNAMDPLSGVRRMVSGYVLRDGQNGTDNLTATGRTNIPAWAQRAYGVGAAQSGPSPTATTNYPLGRYMEDKAYLGDLGQVQGVNFDLDEYNGRFCVTPEFPNGTYAYFVCITSNGAPAFPYNISRRFHGSPAGDAVSSIVEPVTTNFIGGGQSETALAGISRSTSTVTLVWSAAEGGSYIVETSSNLASWSTVAGGVTAQQEVGQAGLTNGADAQFYRVARTNLAPYDAGSGGGGSGIVSISPTSGNRTSSVPFTITLDGGAPPSDAPLNGVLIGTNVIAGATRPTQFTVSGTFNIPAGAATGAQTVFVLFPGAPPNPQNVVTNYLTGGFTIH